MFEELKRKVAVVTGSGGGLGREIARKLADLGAVVIGIDRDEAEGAATAKAICNAGNKGYFEKVDLADENDVKRAFAKIHREFGTTDILVNNAGVCMPTSFSATTKEMWDKTIAVNLTAPFLCIKEVVDEMAKKQYGKIVNICSRSGLVGSKGFAAYSASKFGEVGLTQCVANEYARALVNVNAICPGIVYTPMWDKQAEGYAALKGYDPADVRQELVGKIPMGRLQTEEDIANAVLFLVSDLSANITGQAILVSGGY